MNSTIVMSETNTKNGGPYTKEQQENFRKQVYELHFEKGFSAVSIANKLGINRNTVNEYVKYWQMQFASQLKDQDLGGIVVKQIEKSEIQRKRLLDQLENAEIDAKLRIEKMISEIEDKITGFVSKIAQKQILLETKEEIPDATALEILKKIVFSEQTKNPKDMSWKEIKKTIVVEAECDVEYSENMLKTFEKMGLNIFFEGDEYEGNYNLMSFADAKKILTSEEKETLEQKVKDAKDKEDKEAQERRERLRKRMGYE